MMEKPWSFTHVVVTFGDGKNKLKGIDFLENDIDYTQNFVSTYGM